MIILKALIVLMPWCIKRRLLSLIFGYDLAATARIGLSWIYPKHLQMSDDAYIGHFNVAIHLDTLRMDKGALIARSNWITGFPTGTTSRHFAHDVERKSELTMGEQSRIIKGHRVDCTSAVSIGKFTSIAGYDSLIMSHSVDVYACRQDSHPIRIGDYCFVASRVVILGGAELPSHSVLGAGAVLGKRYTDEWTLYGGVPAKPIKPIPRSAKFFTREEGFIY